MSVWKISLVSSKNGWNIPIKSGQTESPADFRDRNLGRKIMSFRTTAAALVALLAGLGGATLDNEENYLIKKLFMALGAIQVENQARI